ncbi:MAG TPA: FAD binding domain-containing protein [Lacipirellulaceae bacterium]|nr:FAD binding domain-containing protein [Lacipirellulaceae bacterium]
MNSFDYLVAEQFDAAVAEYGRGTAALKAGGIDLLDLMKEGIDSPSTVLSIGELGEFRYIRDENDGVHIGCLTTLADIGRSKLLKIKYPVLHHAAAEAATPQIRERATIAGNLCQRPRCWYFRQREFHCLKKGGATCFAVDGENRYHAIFGGGPSYIVHPSNIAPALVALDAVIHVRSTDKENEPIKAADFFVLPEQSLKTENVLKPGQIISEVVLPQAPTQSATIELREKQSFDWPVTMACVARLDGGWRVCLGSVAPIPWLSRPAMEVLANKDITPELAAAAGEAAVKGADPLADNEYKVQLVKVATKRALLTAAGLEVPRWN